MSRKIKKQLYADRQNFMVQCSHCGKEVKIIPFGYGYIAACCNNVIYSDRKLPPDRSPGKIPEKK